MILRVFCEKQNRRTRSSASGWSILQSGGSSPALIGGACLLCKSLCKASASASKQQELHHLVGNATGIMPVQSTNKLRKHLRGCMKGPQPLHMKSAAATCAARGAGACRAQWAIQAGGAPGIARSAIRATMRVSRKAASRLRYHLECARRAREK